MPFSSSLNPLHLLLRFLSTSNTTTSERVMDWTGGARRRYAQKGVGNAVLRKQKAHFAKVRAGEHPTMTGGMHDAAAATEFRPLMLGSNYVCGEQGVEYEPQSKFAPGARSKTTGRGSTPVPRARGSASRQSVSIAGRRPILSEHRQYANDLDDGTTHMSTRQRLLARSDWLGLKVTRPVQMKFPSSGEKDRIGKRRKIEKQHGTKTMPAEKALFRPAARLPPYEPRMSGALVDEDIRIKVGTDAFASQTQRSRGSHTRVQTSIAPPSTAVSEESMLLQADSDGFETQFDGHDGHQYLQPNTEEQLQQLSAEEHIFQTDALDMAETRYQREFSEASFETLTAHADDSSSPVEERAQETQSVPESHTLHHVGRRTDPPIAHGGDNDALALMVKPSHVERQYYGVPEEEHASGEDDDDDDDDEAIWKELMRIKQTESSNASIVVVRSSSPHITQPSGSHSPDADLLAHFAVNVAHDTRNEEQPGCVMARAGAELHDGQDPSIEGHAHMGMNSAELDQDESDQDEDDIWRQFVLGGRSTQQESPLAGTKTQHTSETEGALPLSASTSQPRNDDFRSDHATTGGSVFDIGTHQIALVQNNSNDSSSQDHANTSMIGHATTAGPWTEDIEDDEEPSPPRRKHSRSSKPTGHKLDPKRFKQSRKRAPYPPLPRVVPRFLPAISTANTAATKSPYDLSDGLSF